MTILYGCYYCLSKKWSKNNNNNKVHSEKGMRRKMKEVRVHIEYNERGTF